MKNIIIAGGAGFIGSNQNKIVDSYLKDELGQNIPRLISYFEDS